MDKIKNKEETGNKKKSDWIDTLLDVLKCVDKNQETNMASL
jgi:hypothetical protein